MSKQVYINLPVSDLERSTAFYEALGFVKNPTFSDDHATCVVWSDEIIVMLLTRDFYKQFIPGREIADTKTASGVLLAINLENPAAVRQFAETAKAQGGEYYQVDMGAPEDQMFGYEVLDPDGNHWEPIWMSADFNPQEV